MRRKVACSISYTSTKQVERIFVSKLLNFLEVENRIKPAHDGVSVCGFRNIQKLFEADVFALRPFDRVLLSNGFRELSW